MLEAKIKFHDVKKCGYYLRGQSQQVFSGISDTLTNLSSWAKQPHRQIINTTCYESNPDEDIRNTYFCDWHSSSTNQDGLLVLWNEVDNDNGIVYGMNPSAVPGNTDMMSTGFGEQPAIPGFPSYFWFIPSMNVFASIKFPHSVQGKGNLDNYLNGYLSNKTSYRVTEDDTVVGFSPTGMATENSSKVYPKFFAVGRKRDELAAELISNVANITKIVKSETLNYSVNEDRPTLERFFSVLLPNPPLNIQNRVITHELQFKPTVAQLRQIINNFSEMHVPNSIRNAGFVYNNGKRIMLNGASVAFSAELNVERGENQIISPRALLGAISNQREDLLRSLTEPAFFEE